jgi:hypothetical protein
VSVLGLLDRTAEIRRATTDRRTTGTVTERYEAIATGVPVSLQGGNGRLRPTDAGRQPTATHRVFTDAGVDVREGDRVVIDGVTYEVTFVERVHLTGAEHHLQIDVALRRGAAVA